MNLLPLGALQLLDFWSLVPLVLAMSLVYAATRHEQMELIIRHAIRVIGMTAGFMFLMLLVLLWVASLT